MSGRCCPPASNGSLAMNTSPGRGQLLADDVTHDRRERAELACERQALRHHLPVAVAKGGRVVHRVPYYGGVCAAHDLQRHLIGRRRERARDHLQRDRIESPWSSAISSRRSSMFPCDRQPGRPARRDDAGGVVLLDDQRAALWRSRKGGATDDDGVYLAFGLVQRGVGSRRGPPAGVGPRLHVAERRSILVGEGSAGDDP